jgi:hypothetical protein
MSNPLRQSAYLSQNQLSIELPKVMVEVLIHEYGPLPWFESAEKRMRVVRAAGRSLCGEAIDRCDELGAFAFEVARHRSSREELRRRRGVLAHRLIITEDEWFDEQADDIGGKGCAFWIDSAHRHLQATSAVRESLSWVHVAPLPRTIRLNTLDALLYFFCKIGVEEMFHGYGSASRLSQGITTIRRVMEKQKSRKTPLG